MASNVKMDLSLFFTIDIIPSKKPINPMIARNGVGRGSRISIAKADNFIAIDAIKSSVRIAAHFPAVVLE